MKNAYARSKLEDECDEIEMGGKREFSNFRIFEFLEMCDCLFSDFCPKLMLFFPQ